MGEMIASQSSENGKDQYLRLYKQVEQQLAVFTQLIKKAQEPGQSLPYNEQLYRAAVDKISTARFHEARGNYEMATEIMTTILNELIQAQRPTSGT